MDRTDESALDAPAGEGAAEHSPYTLQHALGAPCVVNVNGKRHASQVLGVAQDTVWVRLPELGYSVVALPVDLELSEQANTSCYHMQVVLESDRGAILQRTGMLRAQQRVAWRIPVSFMSKMWRGQSKETHPVHVLDLSLGGALVKARANFQLGSYASAVISLPHERPHTVMCQILRGIPQTDGTRLYGLAFQHLPPQTLRVLTVFLWKEIRKRYPEAIEALFPHGTPKAM
jgi:hypothetical protein